MEYWTAFLLGFVGSAHCAGMCGPLAMALPVVGHSRRTLFASRMAYNLGRVVTYAAMGAVSGLIGQGLAMAGFQRWLSLAAGSVILLSLAMSARYFTGAPVRVVGWLKSALGSLLRRRSMGSMAALGLLNGLLPCGLVYVACAPAAATGSWTGGLASMAAFGLGTLPMMLGLSLVGARLHTGFRFKLQRLVPVTLAVVAVLLILRGMALGIPYVSPDLDAGDCPNCHAAP